ncbi:MAG: bifunctional oligoribonuclease/PAP phosphatase NrnA [Clostridiales bacterium]|nr:bifunctional oligoribonuclease/PAP phosphatase NrnA [Clostridiales bacterium]
MFEQIMAQIAAHDTIIIHRHKNPDGDALGSQLGLKHLLKAAFPEKQVLCVGDDAGRFAFMEDSVMDQVEDDTYQNALAIVLDTSASHLISDERYKTAHALCRIDHHLFCEQIAPIEVVDSTAESCCALVTALAMEQNLPLSPIAARSLYTGMVTDSGRFRYDATTHKTFERAAFLMQQSIDLNAIYQNLYATDYEQARLRAQFILKIQFTENNVGYIYTTKEELAALPVSTFTVSRGMVNTMADLKGVQIWVNFTETDEGVLCELRSSRHNINPIAVKYGGGGHMKASGACVKSREEAMQMLSDLNELAGEE